MSSEWKNTEWRKKTLKKPVRYQTRDEIEKIVKEENIDRERFHEVSKFNYMAVLNKFYYTFFDYENNKKPDFTELGYLWLRFRKNLKQSQLIRWGEDYDEYIKSINSLIPADHREDMHYLILSQGWVYEGYIPEIIVVLSETDCWFDDFYVVSKKFEYLVINNEDGDCMYSMSDL